MKVLIVHPILWSHYKAALFSEMARQVHADEEILVLHIAQNHNKYKSLSEVDSDYHQYPYRVLFDTLLDKTNHFDAARGIIRVIKEYKPDVVNLTGYHVPSYWPAMARFIPAGVKFIISNESTYLDHQRTFWKEAWKSIVVRQGRGFFCFGEMSARYLQRLGAKPQRILTKHAAIVDNDRISAVAEAARPAREAERSRQGFPARTLLFVGRLAPEKNLPMFLSVFQDLKKKYPAETADWGVRLLGNGPLLENIATDYADIAAVLPAVEWHEVPKTLVLADALILPSISETWGLVVNEAMICGLPVLVSERCGCVPDLVHEGESGFTFNPWDRASMGAAIMKMIRLSDQERAALGQRGRELVSNFNPRRAVAEMLDGYRRVYRGEL